MAKCKDFSQLIILNKIFLAGKCPPTVYYGPLNEGKADLVPHIQELHDCGVLSIFGQTFMVTTELGEDGHQYIVKQRPYLKLIISGKAVADQVFESLTNTGKMDVYFEKSYPYEVLPGSFEEPSIVTTSAKRETVETGIGDWLVENYVSLSPNLDDKPLYSLRAMQNADPFTFSVVAKEWEDISIAKILIKVMDDINCCENCTRYRVAEIFLERLGEVVQALLALAESRSDIGSTRKILGPQYRKMWDISAYGITEQQRKLIDWNMMRSICRMMNDIAGVFEGWQNKSAKNDSAA